MQILIIVLQSIKKVSLEALANALAIPIEFESRRKKVQRFLSYTELVSTIGSAVSVADGEPYWNAYWGSGRSGLTLKATLM